MILSGDEIRKELGANIVIEPFRPERLNPNSYNLTLHDELMVYEEVVLDMAKPNRVRRIPRQQPVTRSQLTNRDISRQIRILARQRLLTAIFKPGRGCTPDSNPAVTSKLLEERKRSTRIVTEVTG